MYIDMHCHMLPGIDDGARDLEQSLAMAGMAVADGIRTSVMTPHHLNGVYTNYADAIREQVETFRGELAARDIDLELRPGSELHLVPELPEQIDDGRALTLGDAGGAALVELPVHSVPVGSSLILRALLERGIQPVIAHPERNTQLRRDPDQLAEWVDMGCLGQVTAQSCTGRFGVEVRNTARAMIEDGLIHVMASDAHRDERRVPELSAGCDRVSGWIGSEAVRLMTHTHPERLLEGGHVDAGSMQRMIRPRSRPGWVKKMFKRQ